MKKTAVIATAFLSLVLLPYKQLNALDFGIGAQAFYSYWDPAWRGNSDEYKVEPALLTGPVILVTAYDRLTLSFACLYTVKK